MFYDDAALAPGRVWACHPVFARRVTTNPVEKTRFVVDKNYPSVPPDKNVKSNRQNTILTLQHLLLDVSSRYAPNSFETTYRICVSGKN